MKKFNLGLVRCLTLSCLFIGNVSASDFSFGDMFKEMKTATEEMAKDTQKPEKNKQEIEKKSSNNTAFDLRNTKQIKPLELSNQIEPSKLSNRIDALETKPFDTTKWLIAIGIEDYEYTDDVKYSRKSAELFSKLIQKKYGIQQHQSLVLLDNDATMGKIRNKFKRILRQVNEGDTIYFYYNGHGIPVPSQKNEAYLLPSDVEPEFASDDEFFKMKNVFKLLSNSKAQKVIAIIDSCFSGGNDGSSLIKGVAATRLKPKEITFDKKKMVVLYAGKGTQYSNMFEKKGNRLFSYYIMDSILKGRDDVDMLYSEVFINVKDESFKMGDMHLQEPTVLGNKKLNLR